MIRSLVTSIIALLALGASDSPQKPANPSPTYGKPAEAFVTGCDLILRGRDVPKVQENGQWGYKVVKRPDAVLVNGIVYVDKPWELPKMVKEIEPEILREAAVCELAIEYLRNEIQFRGERLVAVAGETHPLGAPFSLTIPDSGYVVEVKFSEDRQSVRLEYGGTGGWFAVARPTPPPPRPYEVRLEDNLDSNYHSLLTHLKPGFLVIRSGALTKYFPLDRADEVRASLARIPGRAKLLFVDSYGEPYDEQIVDGDFVWPSSIIDDVVTAAKEGGR